MGVNKWCVKNIKWLHSLPLKRLWEAEMLEQCIFFPLPWLLASVKKSGKHLQTIYINCALCLCYQLQPILNKTQLCFLVTKWLLEKQCSYWLVFWNWVLFSPITFSYLLCLFPPLLPCFMAFRRDLFWVFHLSKIVHLIPSESSDF